MIIGYVLRDLVPQKFLAAEHVYAELANGYFEFNITQQSTAFLLGYLLSEVLAEGITL